MIQLLREEGYEWREEPFQLASGEWSHHYVDAKRAVARGEALRLVAAAIMDVVAEEGVEFDAVGGLTMGADPLAHAIALLTGSRWFAVRKTPKKHGRQRVLEGAELDADTAVLLVDDVVTTGTSILDALKAIEEVGGRVVLAVSLCDRGESARPRLEERGLRYRPLATYRDLGIEPVSSG